MFCDVFLTLNKKRALRYVLMIGVGGFFAGLSVALLDVFAVNGINYRMILIPMFNYFIITTIVFLIILNVWKGGKSIRLKLNIIAVVFAGALLILSLPGLLRIDAVVSMRALLFDLRERHIAEFDVATGEVRAIAPVPYLYDTEAEDLFYSNMQYDWMMPSIAQYYKLNKDALDLNGVQPEFYCRDDYESDFKGIKTCQQLMERK